MEVFSLKISKDEAIAVLSGELVPLELALNLSQLLEGRTVMEIGKIETTSAPVLRGFKAAFLKLHGNKALNEKKFKRAEELYTLAIAAVRERDQAFPGDGGRWSPALHILFSNRALAYLGIGDGGDVAAFEKARSDAATVIYLASGFGKGYHRLATSLKKLGRTDEARAVLNRGVEKAEASADKKTLADFLHDLGPDPEEERMLAEAVKLSLEKPAQAQAAAPAPAQAADASRVRTTVVLPEVARKTREEEGSDMLRRALRFSSDVPRVPAKLPSQTEIQRAFAEEVEKKKKLTESATSVFTMSDDDDDLAGYGGEFDDEEDEDAPVEEVEEKKEDKKEGKGESKGDEKKTDKK